MKKNSTTKSKPAQPKKTSNKSERRDRNGEHDARVLRAMFELLHNPRTPQDLFVAVAQFCTDQSNQIGIDLFHSESVLTSLLQSVPAEERKEAYGELINATPKGGVR